MRPLENQPYTNIYYKEYDISFDSSFVHHVHLLQKSINQKMRPCQDQNKSVLHRGTKEKVLWCFYMWKCTINCGVVVIIIINKLNLYCTEHGGNLAIELLIFISRRSGPVLILKGKRARSGRKDSPLGSIASVKVHIIRGS